MKTFQVFAFLLLGYLLLHANCTPRYIAANFDVRTSLHEKVAVLPVEVIFTGKIPEGVTDADIQAIKEAESKAFMISFYNEILRSTKSGRKPLSIDVQHYQQTLKTLEQHCTTIEEIWQKEPGELAEMLGVDAVVKARIEKMRFMSDLESYGIDLSIQLVQIFTDQILWPWLPPHITRSKKIRADYAVIDGQDSSTLWSVAFDADADWRQPANEIIDGISRRAARNFPYRY